MLSVFMLLVDLVNVMLDVAMLSVVMLHVMAPLYRMNFPPNLNGGFDEAACTIYSFSLYMATTLFSLIHTIVKFVVRQWFFVNNENVFVCPKPQTYQNFGQSVMLHKSFILVLDISDY
jgi:hypothetical protein